MNLSTLRFKLLRQLVSIVLFCLTLEGMARVDSTLRLLFTGDRGLAPFEDIQYRDAFGPTAIPNVRWRWLTLNKYGFNDTDDYTFARTHRYRILVLGDSIPMGSAVNGGDWPAMVENLLRQKGLDVEVINAGMAATDPTAMIERYETWQKNFHADIVLSQNEARGDMVPTDVRRQLIWPLRFGKQHHSAFTRKFVDFRAENSSTGLILERIRYGVWQVENELPAQNYRTIQGLIDRLHTDVVNEHSRFVLITTPTSTDHDTYKQFLDRAIEAAYWHPWLSPHAVISGMGIINDYLVEYSAQHPDVSTIDLRSDISMPYSGFFTDFLHYTRAGNERVAQRIANELEPMIRALQQ